MSEITFKRGDSFFVVATYTNSSDVPQDITSVGIKSQVRNSSDELLAELVVDKLDQITQLGKYTLATPIGYSLPTGRHKWDIQYTVAGQVQSTETIYVSIIEDVTQS